MFVGCGLDAIVSFILIGRNLYIDMQQEYSN